jgi:hypothetical protein
MSQPPEPYPQKSTLEHPDVPEEEIPTQRIPRVEIPTQRLSAEEIADPGSADPAAAAERDDGIEVDMAAEPGITGGWCLQRSQRSQLSSSCPVVQR